MSEPRSGLIKTAVSKVSSWFHTEEETARESAAQAEGQKAQGARPWPDGMQESPAATPPRTSVVAQKLSILKETLEFSPNLKPKIEKEQSLRALLVLASDELLFRFGKLCEIGFLSPDSAAMLHLFNDKVAAVLACKDDGRGLDSHEEVDRLTKENLALKHKLKALQTHYVQTGVITERELALEKEIDGLKNLMRDQHQQLQVARKKGEQLAEWQEMVHSLKARNNLLNSKVEYQVKLLRSFTADQPKQQELVAMMEKLTEENNRLKGDLERQTGTLFKLESGVDKDQVKAIEELIGGSLQMQDDLEEQRKMLGETKEPGEVETNLLDGIERLTEDNANLRNLFEARAQLHDYLESPQPGATGNLDDMVTKLRAENTRLGDAVKEREAQLKISEETPSSARLVRAYIKLRNEKRELARENRLKDQAYREETAEKQRLQAHVQQVTALRQENRQLRVRVQETERLSKILNKLAKQNELLKKDRAELQLKHERATLDLTRVNEKMAKITREYNMLITEYDKLFAEQ